MLELELELELEYGDQIRRSPERCAIIRAVSALGSVIEGGLPGIPVDLTERVEGRVGNAIQVMVRDYLRDINSFYARHGRVSVGEGVVMDWDEVELYRSPRLRIGHSVGNPPLSPIDWVRNYRGILNNL